MRVIDRIQKFLSWNDVSESKIEECQCETACEQELIVSCNDDVPELLQEHDEPKKRAKKKFSPQWIREERKRKKNLEGVEKQLVDIKKKLVGNCIPKEPKLKEVEGSPVNRLRKGRKPGELGRTVIQFVKRFCEYDSSSVISSQEIYNKYFDWARSVDIRPIKSRAFTAFLNPKRIQIVRLSVLKKEIACVKGIRLKNDLTTSQSTV